MLAPVFLVIALGAVLHRTGFVSPGFFREANRLTYWLGLPALLFESLATSFHEADGATAMMGALFVTTGLVVLLAYLVAWALRVPGSSMGTFVQGSFRGNLAFVGLPIVYTLPDVPGANGLSVRAAAVLVLAPMMLIYNIGGVVVLLVSQHRFGWGAVKPVAKQLIVTPPLVASVAGIIYALLGWRLPAAVGVSLEWLGQMALPLALLGIGSSLVQTKPGAAWRPSLAAALVKSVASPLIGYGIGRVVGLTGIELAIVMIFLASPTAAISYTMVLQLKGDETLASGTILFSTFVSVAALTAIVAWLV